jgi:hypothetical protein
LLDRLTPTIAELTQAIEREVEKCSEARRLQTHPGVGALTALAFVLIIGRADRFQCGKQIASSLGLVPLEESSGQQRRLGHITKQGNSWLRFLRVEAALAEYVAKYHAEWAYQIAELYAFRGEIDRAFEWLERAYAQRDPGLSEMKCDPLLKSLERDPRYAAFLKKMRLPA